MPENRWTDDQVTEIRRLLPPSPLVDVDTLAGHELAPVRLREVVSSRGLEEGRLEFEPRRRGIGYRLDIRAFGDEVDRQLGDLVPGYALELRRRGRSVLTRTRGWAKTPDDGGQPWTTGVRMHVASVSKLVTAMAMTKVLAGHGISPDHLIIDQLPEYWAKGPNVDQITYRHLLTHTSGFDTGDSRSDFATMKAQVAAGVGAVGGYRYQNMNFGLCRILLATLTGAVAVDLRSGFFFLPDDVLWDVLATRSYADFVAGHVFDPACVVAPTLDHPSRDALAYDSPVSGVGWDSGDLTTMAGGAGWHLSVTDLLSIMNAYRRLGSIVSPAAAQDMLDQGFGIDLTLSTPAGTLYNKNGYWADSAGQAEQALAYFLPGEMELVVLTNAPTGAGLGSFRDLVTQAYLDHLVPILVLSDTVRDRTEPLPVG